MARVKGMRIGGSGCPKCGGHNTERGPHAGKGLGYIRWCNTCAHRWQPCEPGCRGYKLFVPGAAGFSSKRGDVPAIRGCPDCGVPDKVAAYWPEAYRAMAVAMDKHKALSLPTSE